MSFPKVSFPLDRLPHTWAKGELKIVDRHGVDISDKFLVTEVAILQRVERYPACRMTIFALVANYGERREQWVVKSVGGLSNRLSVTSEVDGYDLVDGLELHEVCPTFPQDKRAKIEVEFDCQFVPVEQSTAPKYDSNNPQFINGG